MVFYFFKIFIFNSYDVILTSIFNIFCQFLQKNALFYPKSHQIIKKRHTFTCRKFSEESKNGIGIFLRPRFYAFFDVIMTSLNKNLLIFSNFLSINHHNIYNNRFLSNKITILDDLSN